MRTSKLIIKWKNFEKIFEDYDIYHFNFYYDKFVSKNKFKDRDLENEAGKAKQELKALAVVYKRELILSKFCTNKCLFLFAKNSTDEKRIADFIKDHPYISDAKKIRAFDLQDTSRREQYFLKNDRALIQLLINSIYVPRKEKYSYNNINGKLFYRIKSSNSAFAEEKGYLSFIEFYISTEMNLEFSLVTFKKSDYGFYVLDEDENFRYLVSEKDKKLQHYIRESKEKNHNTATFIDFSSNENMINTKIFAIARFMEKVKTSFSEYFEIDFDNKPNITFNKKKLNSEKNNYDLTGKFLSSYFRGRGLYIVNLLKDNVQAKQIQDILIELFKLSPINIEANISDKIIDSAFNVVIGHDAKYYKDNKIENQDKYKEVHKHKLVQYVTVENFKPKIKEKDPLFKKIVNELEIAGEILDGKLKHVWKAVDKDWTFVSYSISKDREDILFVRVKVTTEDKLIFSHFKYTDLLYQADSLDEEAIKIIEYVSEIQRVGINDEYFEIGENNGIVHYGEYVDGLCYSDINNIQTIIKTPFHTLPKYEQIINDLSLSVGTQVINLNEVREVISQIMEKEISKEKYKTLLQKLEVYGETVDFETLDKSNLFYHNPISKKDNWIRIIIDTVYEQKGILLKAEFRSMRTDARYQLSNITDIQYFEQKRPVYNKERNVEKEIPCLSYICGRHQQGMESSLPVGCIIRDVVWQKTCEFEELIKTMAVDFIRNDYFYTVLPFPFKYLREYTKMIENELAT